MRYVWSVWPTLRNKIRSKKIKLLLIDFDGTLVPIARTPDSVLFESRSRGTLADLSGKQNWHIVVISGRSIRNLRSYFRGKRLIYAGNHGLELVGKGLSLPAAAKRIRASVRIMRLLAQKLRAVFYFWPGVTLEDKVYTLSLHFRNLRPDRKLPFNELVNFYREKYRKCAIIWRRGKKAWEIRPNPGWGKGDTALYLAKKFPEALPIIIGDDVTDEDMFGSLKRRGVTIRVGRSKKSSADYYLKSPRDVRKFLGELCRL